MATVYSLVCWGGLTGKTVSISATTDVVTLTNHGLRNGAKLWPSGTLPAELNASTPVYARSTGANTFTLHTSAAGAIANTGQITFAGSSTYAAVILKSDLIANPSNALAPYGLSDTSRWGSRIYDSLSNWNSGRSGASSFDVEVCEIGEAFDERKTTGLTISIPCAKFIVTTEVNGVRSSAFHAGVVDIAYPSTMDCGYRYVMDATATSALTLGVYDSVVDGFSVLINGAGYNASGILLNKAGCCALNMIVSRQSSTTYGAGISFNVSQCVVQRNIVMYFGSGLDTSQYGVGSIIANNLCANNAAGIYAAGSTAKGFWYNNIFIGNTTNYPTASGFEGAANNAGISTDSPYGSPDVTISTTDFANFAGYNFYPASASSPQVDSGADFYGRSVKDVTDGEVPNYNNGGAEAVDIGPYEFDHGYGLHPASTTVTFSGIVAGSEIHVYDYVGDELTGTESCTANQVLTWAIPANPVVTITIIKRGLRWMKFNYQSVIGNQTLPIFQNPDLGYNNPA